MLKTENDVVEREDEHGGDVSVGHGDKKSNNMFNGTIMKEEDEHGGNVGECCRNKSCAKYSQKKYLISLYTYL